MEPNDTNPKPKNPNPTPADDLRAEGIDIVGTSMALDNEFSQPESAPTAPSIPESESSSEDKRPTEPVPAPKATAPEHLPGAIHMDANIPQMPAPAPMPTAPKPAPRETIVFSKIPLEGQPPAEPVEPKPKAAPLQNDPSIKPLRTFKSDAEEAVRYSNVSKIDMVLAEQKKKQAENPIEYENEKRTSPALYIAIVLVVVAVLVGGWYYWFSTTQGQAPTGPAAVAVAPKALVSYAQSAPVALDTSNDPFTPLSAKLAASNAGIGNVFAIAPIETATSTSLAPIERVLGNTHAPNRLVRSLGSDYLVGAYWYDVESPFFVLKNTFYQNAYAGMLDWEKDLGSDMMPFIEISYPGEGQGSLGPSFEDAVVSNVDARVLKDSSGRVVLAYAFPDKDTIVITTSMSGLRYLLDRILQVRTIQ